MSTIQIMCVFKKYTFLKLCWIMKTCSHFKNCSNFFKMVMFSSDVCEFLQMFRFKLCLCFSKKCTEFWKDCWHFFKLFGFSKIVHVSKNIWQFVFFWKDKKRSRIWCCNMYLNICDGYWLRHVCPGGQQHFF